MDVTLKQAIELLAEQGQQLSQKFHLPWPVSIQQSVFRLVFDARVASPPLFAAIVGGASSGKSTVFNNLLGGTLVSRITAKGHCTIGPILVAHEEDRAAIQSWLDRDALFPDRPVEFVELGDNVTGEPLTLAVAFHTVSSLKGVLLFDTPDFTSEAATQEGDVSMSLLPWFDRLIVVVDHERWFDRQNVTNLRRESMRFDQDRMVLFNRTKEEKLASSDEDALHKQAQRLDADEMSILEFRRGRGLALFSPGTLEKTERFLAKPLQNRQATLQRQLADAANQLLNQNEERRARQEELSETLAKTLNRVLPSERECMTSLMMPDERRQLELAYRVLRIQGTSDWIRTQQNRLHRALGTVPVVGSFFGSDRASTDPIADSPADRNALAIAYAESTSKKMVSEMQWALASSSFWDEIRRWTGLEPKERAFQWTESFRQEIVERARQFDNSLANWTARVDSECQGIAPRVTGAVGVGAIAIAVVLIAVPGPVAALTFASAKGAIVGVVGKLAAAAGVGALTGKQAGRLSSVIREKLLGSSEFNAVQSAAVAFRGTIEGLGRSHVAEVLAEASSLVVSGSDTLARALETVRGSSKE